MLQFDVEQVTYYNTKKSPNLPFQTLLIIGSGLALVYYLVMMQWSLVELLLFLVACPLLWLPITAWSYILVRKQITETLPRLVFSLISSYTLTTAVYFGFSVLNAPFVFYVWQVSLVLGWLAYLFHIRKNNIRIPSPKIAWAKIYNLDWILIALIMLSLNLNIVYQTAYQTDPSTGETVHTLFEDGYYHVSLAYELARHTPPSQQVNKAGVLERAYHFFSHLTTTLLANFSFQSDLLRVYIVYHYTIIEVLLCLAFYCIVKKLTGSKWAGYVGVSTLYILAIPVATDKSNPLYYFFYNFYPHLFANLDIVRGGSPETYSGLLVLYGILIASLFLSSCFQNRQSIGWLGLLTGVMMAAIMRFRVQSFLPLAPIFLLVILYAWWQTKQKMYLLVGAACLFCSLLLYLEMRSSLYLPDTSNIIVGATPTKDERWAFSFSQPLYKYLAQQIHDPVMLGWLWQIISIVLFILLNSIGLPLLVATICYFYSKTFGRERLFFNLIAVGALLTSVAGAILITTNYDDFSVGGEMVNNTSWYILPMGSVGIWQAYQFLQTHWGWQRSKWLILSAVILLVSLGLQAISKPIVDVKADNHRHIRVSVNEWQALTYLHDQTPGNSVIMSNLYLINSPAFIAAITGRAVYYGYTNGTIEDMPADNSGENRQEVLNLLWSTAEPDEFCKIITPTVATHLLETFDKPLLVDKAPCLQAVWASSTSQGKVTVWKIKNGR